MGVQIPDFTEPEREIARMLVERRYGKPVEIAEADSELRLDPGSDDMTLCPTLYWHERGAHFVVFKVGHERFRCQFFYSDADQYGTGREEYADLSLCMRTLLQVQSDHERASAAESARATGIEPDDIDYHGPSML
ncbi:MAG: hypothetical protein KJ011_14320 [Burkholderiaceae bacterium]|nr:hypothetical protein [Burkholderiaceae bacterium]